MTHRRVFEYHGRCEVHHLSAAFAYLQTQNINLLKIELNQGNPHACNNMVRFALSTVLSAQQNAELTQLLSAAP